MKWKTDPAYWRTIGFRQASTSLEGIIRWFDRRSEKSPALLERSRFKALSEDLRLRRAELCQLAPGILTMEGEIVEALGHGNFGTVWHVKDPQTGSELAYKVFHPQDLSNREKVDRFERGFHAMERLDHPRIVRVHRLTACPYGYFMDYIPGSNLRRFVGTFDSPADTLGFLITVAETLQHAHGRDVVHRDLKPENILLTYEAGKGWRAYLTDFDLAWFSTATQITKSALGATYYASPEQIDKPGSASARAKTTDMYSFGQLMYFAFCGSDPPRDGSLQSLKVRLRQGWMEEPARRLTELFEKCSQHEPAKRPRDFRWIADELARVRFLFHGYAANAPISADAFVREIAFALSGLEAELDISQNSFVSLSGKLRIGVELSNGEGPARVVCSVHCLEPPAVPGLNHQRMRTLLLTRVDRAIQGYPGVHKRPGNQLPFQVYVELRENLTQEGAIRTSALVGRVIDAIESVG